MERYYLVGRQNAAFVGLLVRTKKEGNEQARGQRVTTTFGRPQKATIRIRSFADPASYPAGPSRMQAKIATRRTKRLGRMIAPDTIAL